jgi:hypothetical protein
VMMRVTGSISTIASTVLSPWQPTDRVLRGWRGWRLRGVGTVWAAPGRCLGLQGACFNVRTAGDAPCPLIIQIVTPVRSSDCYELFQ